MTRFFSKGGELLKRTEQRRGSKVTAATVHIEPKFKIEEFVQKIVEFHVQRRGSKETVATVHSALI